MCFRELGTAERNFFLHNMAHGGTDPSPQAAKGGQQDQVPKSVPPSGFTVRFYCSAGPIGWVLDTPEHLENLTEMRENSTGVSGLDQP